MPKKVRKQSQEIVNTFVDFLVEEKEPRLLSEVARELQNVARNAQKDQKIQVTSAVRLEDDEKKRLQSFFKSVLNKQYPLVNIIRPEILGGLRVEWGDFMLDMTLRSRLVQLRQDLQ